MSCKQKTHASKLSVRNSGRLLGEQAVILDPVKKSEHPGEAFMKNLAVAAALVLCVVTLRTGAIPQLTEATDVVLAAASDHSLLDDQLGKLSFVSALFPEAVLVFGEQEEMALPVSSGVISHEWSAEEPYMAWRTDQSLVTASMDGEVMGVYHGNGDERIVQVMADSGLTCLYGNLSCASVAAGDYVMAGAPIGELLAGEELVFEIRREGQSLNPLRYLPE